MFRVTECLDFLTQNFHTVRVKRRDHRFPLLTLAEQFLSSLGHLLGGFVCERDRENSIGSDTAADELNHAVSDHASLAGSGTGENQQRSGKSARRVSLRRVEVSQTVHIAIAASPE